ncbi:hypothetical protein BS47DRAFT_146608 [Hydnum rufescens UP504]|uniref:Uncharacterized protein n=1 Tax=Hydnum rufescens UP504 TaxID=1448309 RepID=A0A9P6APA9_9AGAM|nr:hypothetical protein BS47DRAFT_146608 [Hydnum rufescens UP504]
MDAITVIQFVECTRLHASPLYNGQVGVLKSKLDRRGSLSDEHCRPDGEMPEGLLVDMRERDLVADQPKIRLIYGKFDAIRERNLNLHTAELRAQAAEEAQREAEELAASEAEGRRIEAEGRRIEAEGRHAAEAQIAKLQEQLRPLAPDSAYT